QYGPGCARGGQLEFIAAYLLDWIEIIGQEISNYPLAIPALYSVTEFRVQTSNYSAEFVGNSGAIVNVASKRGSNQYHGTFYEFLRNNDLYARNFFDTGVASLKRNHVGFTLSVPVVLLNIYNGPYETF